MMSALLYPLVTFVLLLVCVTYWGSTALYPLISIYSMCVYICIQLTKHHGIPFVIKGIRSSLKLMIVDIWRLQEVQSTEWWLSTQR